MRPRPSILAAVTVAVLAVSPAFAGGGTVIKLGTLAPDGSVWDKVLHEMGSDWQQVSGGRVTLRVYAGGIAGDEPDLVRKMRIGQLQASTLTTASLSDVDESFKVFEVPMFFASYDEVSAVLARLAPMLEQRLEAKGFVIIQWGYAGWVQFFSTRPVRTPDDLKGLKLFTRAGNDRVVQWWKDDGYHPVPLATTDILTGLQTGMIEALPTTPLAALSLQWYRLTPYMLELGLAPLVGATVVSKKSWDEIAESDRTALLSVAHKADHRLETEIPEEDRAALVEMQKRGLTVVAPSGGGKGAGWSAEAARFVASMRQRLSSTEVFDLAVQARDELRRQEAGGGKP